ncbi:SDR family NAD(P)-dependent oxidoreductase [Hydrogenophaga sp.]|uniref:SDR family NAD(P)-dependent oxidoreductase n=1 Tax=Hydrogenophaga sp. TaxID=1904254 RepID=UPI00272A8CD8|nr:glucose 1-dehydrogenase [Hydrogenophaga sp.]
MTKPSDATHHNDEGHGLLKDRIAVITGGAQGLGLGMAQTFIREGAQVVIADLNEEALEQTVKTFKSAGHDVLPVIANVGKVDDCERIAASAVKHFGKIDILVNNAGGSAYTPQRIEEVTEEHYDRVMDWNVRGTLFCTKAALPALKVNGGAVINFASMSGRMGADIFSPQYSAAKAAIIGITRNLAKQLGPSGIRVNAIAPGFVRASGRTEAIWNARDNTQILNQIALRRRGVESELADVAVFLASFQSRYMSGCILDVNGGYQTF